jgi:hypothetical protein
MNPPCVADAFKGYRITLAPGAALTELDLGNFCTASVRGVVYMDYDADGNKDPNDPYLSGVTVTLVGTDEQGNAITLTTMTDSQGKYWFIGLLPGTYTVCLTPPPGTHQTFPRSGAFCPNGPPGHTLVFVACESRFAKFAITPDALGESEGLTVTDVKALVTAQALYLQVVGQGIKDWQVQIFDLRGKIIYASLWQSNGWAWDLRDNHGLYVPGGVYFYVVTVRDWQGEITKTRLKKLLIGRPTLQASTVSSIQALLAHGRIYFIMAGQNEIRDLQVQVLDLNERIVYKSDWQSGGWVWMLQDNQGNSVARGVYLILVLARSIDGEIVKTQLRKLVVK